MGARGSGFRSLVGIVRVASEQSLKVDSLVSECLTANIEGADGRAAIDFGVRVIHSSITLLSKSEVSDTISAKWSGALACATNAFLVCPVAFFVRIGQTITAEVSLAVASASIGNCIAVSCSIIAVLGSLFNSISTVFSTARTTVVIDVVLVVALLTAVNHAIAAASFFAGCTTSIGCGVVVCFSVVALFAAEVVNHIVTAEEKLAVHAASVWSGITVTIFSSGRIDSRVSVIALFPAVNLSVTTSPSTVVETKRVIQEVALLIGIHDSVAAEGELAIWSAST